MQKARKALGVKGFVAIKKGTALYKKAKELYARLEAAEATAFPRRSCSAVPHSSSATRAPGSGARARLSVTNRRNCAI